MYSWMAPDSLAGAMQIVVFIVTMVGAMFSLMLVHR